jgi:flagellin-like hook-associated protein FlgL
MSIIGIPTTRVSDSFVRQRLLDQTQNDQLQLFRLQTQLSTGHRFDLPSDDPIASAQVMSLQRLMERKTQVQRNLATNQSYLGSTDVAMSSLGTIVSDIRGAALGVMGTTTTDDQRDAAVQQVQQAMRQLIDIGNQKFRGRYIFAGSNTQVEPFQAEGDTIQYSGNEGELYSYSDTDLLFETNMPGSQVFGAISEAVHGSVDLGTQLTFDTRLADLRGGQGIHASAIEISDGNSRQVVDLSKAETIGDVALLIRNNAPADRTLDVEVGYDGLRIRLVPDPGGGSAENLSIREVGGGTAAAELGILNKTGVGNDWLEGEALDPVLQKTTSLDEVLGRRARACVHLEGDDNDFILQADAPGDALNGVNIVFHDDASVTEGDEKVVYTPGQIEVLIDEGYTKVKDIVAALQKAHNDEGLPFDAWLDPVDSPEGGQALVSATPVGQTAGQTAGGRGIALDRTSGLQIVNDEKTVALDFSEAKTVEDLLNVLNRSSAGVLAQINAAGTGIDVRSRISGCDFAIGENGGTTASQLGLRTFTDQTRLDQLNYGNGIHERTGGSQASATFEWPGADNDLTFTARGYGAAWNGFNIEFVNTGARSLTYDRYARTMTFTIDDTTKANDILALVAANSQASADFQVQLTADQGQPNSGGGLVAAGSQMTAGGSDDGVEFTLTRADGVTLQIDVADCRTIEDVMARINNHPDNTPLIPGGAPALIAQLKTSGNGVELVDSSGGTGKLAITRVAYSSVATELGWLSEGQDSCEGQTVGGAQVISGSDVNSQETEGIFTALLRLKEGLEKNDTLLINRAVNLLDQASLQATFSRADLGARQQGLDVLSDRLDAEEVDLKNALSLEYDADFVDVVSNLAARQAAFEASMMATGKISQMTLMNYL